MAMVAKRLWLIQQPERWTKKEPPLLVTCRQWGWQKLRKPKLKGFPAAPEEHEIFWKDFEVRFLELVYIEGSGYYPKVESRRVEAVEVDGYLGSPQATPWIKKGCSHQTVQGSEHLAQGFRRSMGRHPSTSSPTAGGASTWLRLEEGHMAQEPQAGAMQTS